LLPIFAIFPQISKAINLSIFVHRDQQYIEALRHNDERLIREIYKQHSQQVLRWIVSRGGSADDARDIFQEAIIALHEKAQKLDFVLTCPLGALLHVICSRKWIDQLRQKGKDQGVRNEEERRYTLEQESDALTIAEDTIAEEQKHVRLKRAFEQLTDLCRKLLTLLSNGTSPKEAAENLQMNSVDTLYRRKNACTERWRNLYLDC
jgi:RNA polymerase sigma factor (sigma-70 family)